MSARTIAVRITLDNRDALNAAKAQVVLTRELNKETDRQTQLQSGLTNSFIKGNLAARAISIGYNLAKDALFTLVQTSIQFEYTMAKIEAVSGSSKSAMQAMESTVRSLALATNQSQTEIAKTALEMGKMGLTSSQVEEALGGVVRLSKALDEGLVQTGETVVGVMNAYSMSANEIDKITNQLAFTVKESALNMEKFGIAFSYAGGTAVEAGVSFEELQGAMDILSNAGIRASTIGTSLRRIISDLSDENSNAAKAAGGTIASYGGLANALTALKSKNLEIEDLTAIFGRTASSTSAVVIKYAEAVGDLAKRTGEVGDIVTPMSEVMNTTFKGAVDGLVVSFKDLGIELSKSLGWLTSLVGMMEKAIELVAQPLKVDNLVEEFQKKDPKGYADASSNWAKSSTMWSRFKTYRPWDLDAMPDNEVFNTSQYVAFANRKQQQTDKEKSAELLQTSLGKQSLPKGWDPGKASQFNIKAEDTALYNYVQKLWGTDEAGFNAVREKAIRNWALRAEKVKEESDFPELKDKKVKKKKDPYVELDPFVMMGDALNEQQKDGKTYQENFTEKLAKEKTEIKKAKGSPVKSNLISKDEIEAFVAGMETVYTSNLKAQASFVAMQASIQGVNGSMDILSGYIVEGFFSEKKDPFKHISDAFGDFAKKMAADLVALSLKILFFRGLLAVLSLSTGGAGAALTPFVTQLASATTGTKFASGTDQVVTKPTMFMAGESGKERVTVTPRAKMSSGGSGGGITVNIAGDVLDGAKFAEAVETAQKRLRGRSV